MILERQKQKTFRSNNFYNEKLWYRWNFIKGWRIHVVLSTTECKDSGASAASSSIQAVERSIL